MGLKGIISRYVQLPPNSAPRARGVRYFVPIELYKAYWGAMNMVKDGRRYKKHIVVRRMPYAKGLLQLYTYHFPKTWSAACVANRELIKQAQRQAHALEHAHTPEALEWRIRFFNHYFTVVKGGSKPEPGLKPYARFYQYTYVAIYRQLQARQRQTTSNDLQQRQTTSNDLQLSQTLKDVSFDQIDVCSLQADTIRRSMTREISRSFARSPLRSAARRTFLAPSLDESFILKPLACFSG